MSVVKDTNMILRATNLKKLLELGQFRDKHRYTPQNETYSAPKTLKRVENLIERLRNRTDDQIRKNFSILC